MNLYIIGLSLVQVFASLVTRSLTTDTLLWEIIDMQYSAN